MPQITWRNIDNPNFSGVNDALRLAAGSLDKGFQSARDAVGDFQKYQGQQASSALMKNVLQLQDPNALKTGLANGSVFQGVDMSNISPEALRFAQESTGKLLDQNQTVANTNYTNASTQHTQIGNAFDQANNPIRLASAQENYRHDLAAHPLEEQKATFDNATTLQAFNQKNITNAHTNTEYDARGAANDMMSRAYGLLQSGDENLVRQGQAMIMRPEFSQALTKAGMDPNAYQKMVSESATDASKGVALKQQMENIGIEQKARGLIAQARDAGDQNEAIRRISATQGEDPRVIAAALQLAQANPNFWVATTPGQVRQQEAVGQALQQAGYGAPSAGYQPSGPTPAPSIIAQAAQGPGYPGNPGNPGNPQQAPVVTGSPSGGNTLDTIKSFEGYRDGAYWDVNHFRAGYGSDTATDPTTGKVRIIQKGDTVTKAEAEADLARRVGVFQNGIRQDVRGFDQMPENVKAALTSVAYNYGHLPKDIVAAANSGDVNQIAQAIQNRSSDNDGVNAGRRAKEAALVLGQAIPSQGGSQVAGTSAPAVNQALANAASRGKSDPNAYTRDYTQNPIPVSGNPLLSNTKVQQAENPFSTGQAPPAAATPMVATPSNAQSLRAQAAAITPTQMFNKATDLGRLGDTALATGLEDAARDPLEGLTKEIIDRPNKAIGGAGQMAVKVWDDLKGDIGGRFDEGLSKPVIQNEINRVMTKYKVAPDVAGAFVKNAIAQNPNWLRPDSREISSKALDQQIEEFYPQGKGAEAGTSRISNYNNRQRVMGLIQSTQQEIVDTNQNFASQYAKIKDDPDKRAQLIIAHAARLTDLENRLKAYGGNEALTVNKRALEKASGAPGGGGTPSPAPKQGVPSPAVTAIATEANKTGKPREIPPLGNTQEPPLTNAMGAPVMPGPRPWFDTEQLKANFRASLGVK